MTVQRSLIYEQSAAQPCEPDGGQILQPYPCLSCIQTHGKDERIDRRGGTVGLLAGAKALQEKISSGRGADDICGT
jgi:hypothetical protein